MGKLLFAREVTERLERAGYKPPVGRLKPDKVFQLAAYPRSEVGTGVVVEAGCLESASLRLVEECERLAGELREAAGAAS